MSVAMNHAAVESKPAAQRICETRILTFIYRFLFAFGIVMLCVYGLGKLYRVIFSRAELTRFQQVRKAAAVSASDHWTPEEWIKVDFSLWSPKRITDYQESLAAKLNPPLAVLRVPRLGLEVPLLEGTDDVTLNRGVGHILGTSSPGEGGNVGIAGHRDGFFRVLKDVATGDQIELLMPGGTEEYVVDQIVLVKPEDVSVLQPRTLPSLTLVTCYPFYYIGSAPRRYIVHASMMGRNGTRTEDAPKMHVQLKSIKTE